MQLAAYAAYFGSSSPRIGWWTVVSVDVLGQYPLCCAQLVSATVVLMRNLAVGHTYTILIYVQGGKLEGSEKSEKSEKGSEKEVKSVL